MADPSSEQRLRIAGHLFRSHEGEAYWVQVEERPNYLLMRMDERDVFLDRIFDLEAELEDTRQAWVDGEEPGCEDVCMVACKGPCGGAG